MRLQRLTGLERDKIIADYEAVMKEITRLEEILASEDLIRGIIENEFAEILESYGDERRTEIVELQRMKCKLKTLLKMKKSSLQ